MIGEYDLVKGLSAFLRSVGIDVKYKLCSHSLKVSLSLSWIFSIYLWKKKKFDILKKSAEDT